MDIGPVTELIAPRAQGRAFTHARRPGLGDCAPSGRVRLDALARWLQDVAYEDVEDAGVEHLALWVVRRMRLRVDRFPRFGQRYTVTTFCSGLGRMWAERRTTVARLDAERPDVEAVALWVHLHPETGHPSPVTEAELDVYAGAAAGRRVRARLRHPSPDAARPGGWWAFRASECDLADHINNAAYWAVLEEDLLAGPDPAQLDAEVEFRTPAQPGQKRLLRLDDRLWIVNEAGDVHASVLTASSRSGDGRMELARVAHQVR